METVVKPLWPSEPPHANLPGSLMRVEGGVARRAMVIDGDLLLAEAAWRGEVVHLRGDDERALERMRFLLALDDDLAPFHRAYRGDPLLGRVLRARPRLRVVRVPDPFEALAWGVMFQLIDTARAGQIAWAFTRAHGRRHACGLWAAPPREAFTNQAALEACGLAPTQARTLARAARAGLERAATVHGIGEWTLAQLDLFGRGRYDVPLAKDVGIRNAYARMIGARTGSVTEDEFRRVLDRYAPWQGLAARYMIALGWRSGGRYHSGHALRRQ
jgi:3-methyladenine DNA glycosylase/8-oxoguanine DNA glycosylase